MDALRIDPTRLTLNELEEIEELTGKSSIEIFGDGNGRAPNLSAKALKALVFVIGKRDDPDLTLEKAGEVDISALQIAEPDPTDAAGPTA